MKNFCIRKATLKDLDGLVALEQISFTTDQLSRKNFQHLLPAASAEVLVAISGESIVGSLVVFFRKNSRKGRLYSLAVHPAYRTGGIASLLCAHMEKLAHARGCDNITLEVNISNHSALKFYQKHGYKISGERKKFYQDGTDAFTMQKSLNSVSSYKASTL